MWIFKNNSMLSIVADFGDEDYLLVRARREGDIENVFPNAEVFSELGSDYTYRAFILRQEVADVIADEIFNIDYFNFKDSINSKQKDRKEAYMDVWRRMLYFQIDEHKGQDEV